jgi:hypothetical protein
MKLRDAIDAIFSHNEIVALYEPLDYGSISDAYESMVWKGMAHRIPEDYLSRENWRIFGCVPETIFDGDAINIRFIYC